ncbi:hypothetical protein XENOCAPTIV_012181, partial [Xenoophorus captivus]
LTRRSGWAECHPAVELAKMVVLLLNSGEKACSYGEDLLAAPCQLTVWRRKNCKLIPEGS